MKRITKLTGISLAITLAPIAHSFELGVKTWFGDGKTQWAHNAQVLNAIYGNPTSRLTYQDATGPIFEFTASQELSNQVDIAGSILVGSISDGKINDEDYFSAEYIRSLGYATDSDFKFLETVSSINDGDVSGFTLEAGYTFANNKVPLRLNIGYMNWSETYHAFGSTIVVCRLRGCAPAGTSTVSDDTNSLSDKVEWRMLYIGGDLSYQLGIKTHLDLGLKFMPFGDAKNTDTHHLRQDFAKPSVIQSGDAMGWQADVLLSYYFNQQFSINGGYRFRSFSVDYTKNGDITYLSDGSSFAADLAELESERTGFLLGLKFSF